MKKCLILGCSFSAGAYYIDKDLIIPEEPDPLTGYCYGCGINEEEKKKWKDLNVSEEWKKNNLMAIQKRLKGWQLDSFKESYSNKIKKK